MAIRLVRGEAELSQVFLSHPSAFPNQRISPLDVALPEIPADHFKYFEEAEKSGEFDM
jgi:hypothetical protein